MLLFLYIEIQNMKIKIIGLWICFILVVCNAIGKTFIYATTDSIPARNLYKNTWNSKNTRSADIFTTQQYLLNLNMDNENSFIFPCRLNAKICSDYGIRGSRMHTGVDIKLNAGDSIVAAWDGVVRIANEGYYGYGKLVVLRHNNGLETFYAHLSKLEVEENQIVHAGDLIGLAGRTGRATTDHLHFETRFLYEHFNPHTIIDFNNKTLITTCLKVSNKKFSAGENTTPLDTSWHTDVSDMVNLYEQLFEYNDTTKASLATDSAIQNLNTTPIQSEKPTIHIIKKGDTLYGLSKKYHISINELCKLNNIKAESTLQLGQKIKLK